MACLPSKFELAGHTFTVKRMTPRQLKKLAGSPVFGLFTASNLTLYITTDDGGKISESVIEQTFWHEFFHALFWTLGRNEMHIDEVLVDQCGAMLHQALKTMQHS